mmetsp:Transcript_30689/g.51853  ORF Transcript_30689/g.51853 Transcript_30689/m.51853 type:complete len:122 (-) Transcript_30689:2-367(-)
MFRSRIMRAIVQDMPPPGGFPKVEHGSKITERGPSGLLIWSTSILCICFGFYRVGQTNIERRHEKQEIREARYAITPVLQAETDLRYVEARRAGLVPKNVYQTPNLWSPPTLDLPSANTQS